MPRGLLIAAAALVGFSLLAVGTARVLHLQKVAVRLRTPVRQLHLRFADRDDGAVEVHDEDQADALVHVVPAGTNGFMRGVLRALARARRNEHVGPEAPFTLSRWSDGQMTLLDPQTGRLISLEVFGPTNARAFAQLLKMDQEPKP